jgi:hypothetical protein
MATSGVTSTFSLLAQTRHALWNLVSGPTDTLPGSHSSHRARHASAIFGSVADEDAAAVPDLRAKLLLRVERDPSARRARTLGEGHALEDLVKVDLDNSRWLAGVLDDHDWPGGGLVGDDGARAAWLLAQHADQDPVFQRRCLDLLSKAVENGEASPAHAYLTDRVQPKGLGYQTFGTQYQAAGVWVFQPVNEPESLEEVGALGRAASTRRAARVHVGNLRPGQGTGLAKPGAGPVPGLRQPTGR